MMNRKEKFIVDVMTGKIESIDEVEKLRFKKYYKDILLTGYYLAMHKGKYFFSNKHNEKCIKQLEQLDEFIKNIFIEE